MSSKSNQKSSFQSPEKAREIMKENISKARARGENVKITSAKVHSCNRCIECNGQCPT
jgi:succinate dehydrogenase/fumarate reductase-like Fe-S protein